MQAVKKKKKKASASDWLKPVVVGQSQDSHLQATETISDCVKQKRNLLKGYPVTHKTTEKAGEAGSENPGTRNSESHPRPAEQGWDEDSMRPLPRAATTIVLPPPSVLDTTISTTALGAWIFLLPCSLPPERILHCPYFFVSITSDSMGNRCTWLDKSWLCVHVLVSKEPREESLWGSFLGHQDS